MMDQHSQIGEQLTGCPGQKRAVRAQHDIDAVPGGLGGTLSWFDDRPLLSGFARLKWPFRHRKHSFVGDALETADSE